LNKEREMKFVAYVKRGGRITIPKGVRDALSIEVDDLVECTVRKVKKAV